jgi:hypothetical protein
MRGKVAWGGEPGLPHGTTFGGWRWACRRFGVLGCTSCVAIAGVTWGEVKRSPTGFREHIGSGTPGSRGRGNPGLWKRSPAAGGRERRREKVERRWFGWGPVARPKPGVRCFHRFPMRREVAVGGEPGLPHGTTFGMRQRDPIQPWSWAPGPRSGTPFGVLACAGGGVPGVFASLDPRLMCGSPSGNVPAEVGGGPENGCSRIGAQRADTEVRRRRGTNLKICPGREGEVGFPRRVVWPRWTIICGSTRSGAHTEVRPPVALVVGPVDVCLWLGTQRRDKPIGSSPRTRRFRPHPHPLPQRHAIC